MRVNIYAEEMTDRLEIIGKEIDGHTFTGLRFYLELPATLPDGTNYAAPFMHRPGDDDSAAVTFWGKRDLRTVLRKALAMLDEHYGPSTPSQESPGVRDDVDDVPDVVRQEQASCMHPITQVKFRAGLLACREYMARFVEAESPTIAASIRANWWPRLGPDPGPPRKLDWNELTGGEYGEATFRVKGPDEVSPSVEALPIALAFLEAAAAPAVLAHREAQSPSLPGDGK